MTVRVFLAPLAGSVLASVSAISATELSSQIFFMGLAMLGIYVGFERRPTKD